MRTFAGVSDVTPEEFAQKINAWAPGTMIEAHGPPGPVPAAPTAVGHRPAGPRVDLLGELLRRHVTHPGEGPHRRYARASRARAGSGERQPARGPRRRRTPPRTPRAGRRAPRPRRPPSSARPGPRRAAPA